MKWLYLLIDLLTIIVPLVFSFHPRLQFYKKYRFFLPANMLAAAVFILWDIYFTHIGVWSFNPRYVSGLYIANLPIEEVLFFICIPYACVFTFHCVNLLFKVRCSRRAEKMIVIFFSAVMTILGLTFFTHLYTSVTFISLTILLWIWHARYRVLWLGRLLCIYPLLLIPFFIVNGVLTGTGIEQPVVMYNDNHNLGIRLLTIPVEDIFYGFELIALNIFFYFIFEDIHHRKNSPTNLA